jgi:hypothetical protein
MAGLLLFVWPTEAARCRRWHVRNALVLNLFINSDDDELVDVVRLLWKIQALCQTMREELTRIALHRLGKDRAKFLRYFLVQERRWNSWVRNTLKKSGDAQVPPSGRFKHSKDLKLELWHSAGDLEECRLCGFRPPTRLGLLGEICKRLWYVFCCTRLCKSCEYRAIGWGLYNHPTPKKPWDWMTQDAAAATSSGGIGLQELFGEE